MSKLLSAICILTVVGILVVAHILLKKISTLR